jgi:hypothetical protein
MISFSREFIPVGLEITSELATRYTRMTVIRTARVVSLIFAMIAMAAACSRSFAQTTAFTYQGSLANGGLPANGSYDLTFTLFNTNAGGAAIAGPVTNSATAVSNGLFTVTIDFGAGVFNGGNDWLEIAVQTNGGSGFTTLAPRQQITPTPYAIYSANAGSALTATTATTAGSSTTATSATSATSAATATTANNFSGSLAGDVTGTQTATVVSAVGGQSAANVAGGVAAANAATNANTPNTIVQRDASGNFIASTITAASFSGNGSALTNLNASQLTGGTIPTGILTSGATNLPGHLLVVTGGTRQITYNGQSLTNIQGSNVVGAVTLAATATTATSATTATTANNFSGSLAGDVTGTQGATVVSAVGGQSAASVASGAAAANAATNANTPNTIVQRDASGNFIAGTITGNLAGNATTATTATNVTGNIADSQLSANVALLNGTNVFSGTNSFTGPVIITNSASQFSGTFNGTVVGPVTATNFSGSLSGDVTGTQTATVVSAVGGQSAASIAGGTAAANAATNANNPNTIVQRDASGNFNAGTINSANLTVTNLAIFGPSASTISDTNVVINGASPAVLGNGAWNVFSGSEPVVFFRPVGTITGLNDEGIAFDLMPNGTNQQNTWMDICSSDFYVNSTTPQNGYFLHLQKDANGAGHITNQRIGGSLTAPLYIQDGFGAGPIYLEQQTWFGNNSLYIATASASSGELPLGGEDLIYDGGNGIVIAEQNNNAFLQLAYHDAAGWRSALEITNNTAATLSSTLKLMKSGGYLFSGAGTNNFSGTINVANGISTSISNLLATISITITDGTTLNFTNPISKNIGVGWAGGSGVTIGVNGSSWPNNGFVILQPGEYISITNTIAPTAAWKPF